MESESGLSFRINQNSNRYEVNGHNIRVGWKRFDAKKEAGEDARSNENATIFFMGWGMNENSRSIQGISQELADSSGTPAIYFKS